MHARRSTFDGLEIEEPIQESYTGGHLGSLHSVILAIFLGIYNCFIAEVVPKLTRMPLAVRISLFSCEVSCTTSCLHIPPNLASLYEMSKIA